MSRDPRAINDVVKRGDDPARWRQEEFGQRPAVAAILLRGARRPRPPADGDLARLGAAVSEIPRRSAISARRWMRLASAAAGVATLVALGTGVWAWRGRMAAAPEPATAVAARVETLVRTRRETTLETRAGLVTPPGAAAARPAASKPAARRLARVERQFHAAPAAAPVHPDALAREIALIDAGREQLTSAPARALAALDQHRRQFPIGQLAAERELLAVEVLRRLGRPDDARRRASELAARTASCCGAGEVCENAACRVVRP